MTGPGRRAAVDVRRGHDKTSCRGLHIGTPWHRCAEPELPDPPEWPDPLPNGISGAIPAAIVWVIPELSRVGPLAARKHLPGVLPPANLVERLPDRVTVEGVGPWGSRAFWLGEHGYPATAGGA